MKGTVGQGGTGTLPVGIMGRTYMPPRRPCGPRSAQGLTRTCKEMLSRKRQEIAGEGARATSGKIWAVVRASRRWGGHGQDAHATDPEQLAKPGETKSVLENVGP